ncbi:hypothetical protein [Natronospira bacteriovora]|uniref:Outer membrane protein beta-barrel domain-containing protein n=1 Tax=Natronospira bacteriovora TaxID=3069753 RepID=A0ABU0W4J3_9GAMM|nr:hypothetical protein [Natronospira sp. AB-CW4]MDQ2068901.1 hypothetical protein [Natronospira sp. AB-CW4]
MRQLQFGLLVLALSVLAPPSAHAEPGFGHDYLSLSYTRLNPDRDTALQGTTLTGLAGRLNLSIAEHSWVALERESLSSEEFDDDSRLGLEYNALLFGAGQMITDRGMAYVEAGPSFSHLRQEATVRSVVFAVGIRTRISPRFELGGGPRLDGRHRLDPDDHEWSMRVQGVFDLSDRVALSGSYDYREESRQWRLGARVRW